MKKRQRKKNAKRDGTWEPRRPLYSFREAFKTILARFAFKVDTSRLRQVQEDVQGVNLQLKLQAARKAYAKFLREHPEAARRMATAWMHSRIAHQLQAHGIAMARKYVPRDEKGESTARPGSGGLAGCRADSVIHDASEKRD